MRTSKTGASFTNPCRPALSVIPSASTPGHKPAAPPPRPSLNLPSREGEASAPVGRESWCASFKLILHRLRARLRPFSDLCDRREGKPRLAWRERGSSRGQRGSHPRAGSPETCVDQQLQVTLSSVHLNNSCRHKICLSGVSVWFHGPLTSLQHGPSA